MKNNREATTEHDSSRRLLDNRIAIEKLYNDGREAIRCLIQKAVTDIRVNGNNCDLLIAEISDIGIIEIINDRNGGIVPWSYLTDAERWSFWQYFNRLLDAVECMEK